jgi:hypothetical protein
MPQKRNIKRRSTRSTLRLPDLDHSKNSVLQSLGSAASKRTYGAAIEDFISWYCSEPRLAFGRTVVLRYRYELESRGLAAATINLRLAAMRRLAYEASDNGLLNPDLAAASVGLKGLNGLLSQDEVANSRKQHCGCRARAPEKFWTRSSTVAKHAGKELPRHQD